MDTANVRRRLPTLATAEIKLPKSTTVTNRVSKTLARATSIVPQKTIHNFVCSTISSKTQTEQFSSETLKRVESILSGPHSGAFCQIIDIFMSGFGKLNIDSDLPFVRLVYEEKTQIKKNLFHNVSFVRASCEEQSESIENHYNLQFVYYQILNEQ